MKIVVPIPELSQVPTGWWVAIGAAIWYVVAAVFIRVSGWGRELADNGALESPPPVIAWLLSPLVLPYLMIERLLVGPRKAASAVTTGPDRSELESVVKQLQVDLASMEEAFLKLPEKKYSWPLEPEVKSD